MTKYKISVNNEKFDIHVDADSPAAAALEAAHELYAFYMDGTLDPDESMSWQVGVKAPKDPKTHQFTVKVELAFTVTETQ